MKNIKVLKHNSFLNQTHLFNIIFVKDTRVGTQAEIRTGKADRYKKGDTKFYYLGMDPTTHEALYIIRMLPTPVRKKVPKYIKKAECLELVRDYNIVEN